MLGSLLNRRRSGRGRADRRALLGRREESMSHEEQDGARLLDGLDETNSDGDSGPLLPIFSAAHLGISSS